MFVQSITFLLFEIWKTFLFLQEKGKAINCKDSLNFKIKPLYTNPLIT
jgi:hypothetical protein